MTEPQRPSHQKELGLINRIIGLFQGVKKIIDERRY